MTKNEQEEKTLLAFLERLGYNYQNGVSNEAAKAGMVFLEKYSEDMRISVIQDSSDVKTVR